MNAFLKELTDVFQLHADPDRAKGQKAYMRGKFEYFGIKTPDRRKIQKPFMQWGWMNSPERRRDLAVALWKLPQRDFQYFGQEMLHKQSKNMEVQEIDLIEYILTHKSWWDTVDFIATKIAATYFKNYPHRINEVTDRWLDSENIWLIRTALLFQLHYKEATDTVLLEKIIISQLGSKEFFINKAIGWILRQYSRTDPKWVLQFAGRTDLNPLSKREGLKYC